MRKFFSKFLLLSGVIGLLFLVSCEDDDGLFNQGPSIDLTVEDTVISAFSGYVGDTLPITADVNSEIELQTLTIRKDVSGAEDSDFAVTETIPAGQTSFTYTVDVPLKEDEVGETVEIIFEASDIEGNTSTQTVDITVEERPTAVFTAVLLFAPTGDKTSETFFSTENGETYSRNEIEGVADLLSPDVDFGYYYGVGDLNNEASLASPASYPSNIYDLSAWDQLNETKLRLTDLTTSEFIENENDEAFINEAFANATPEGDPGQVTNLNVDDIVAFELDESRESRHGLIRIVDIVDGNNDGAYTGEEDYIEIEVVVNQQ